MKRLALLTVLLLVATASRGADALECNLLTNGSMEFWSRYHPDLYQAMLRDQPPFDAAAPPPVVRQQQPLLRCEPMVWQKGFRRSRLGKDRLSALAGRQRRHPTGFTHGRFLRHRPFRLR